MQNLKKFEVKNLDQITAGSKIRLIPSGMFDGIKFNEDIRIVIE